MTLDFGKPVAAAGTEVFGIDFLLLFAYCHCVLIYAQIIYNFKRKAYTVPISSAQCRMARAAILLGVRDLAEKAKVSPSTITRLEAGEELRERTLDAIQAALESAGVEFIAENGGGAGVRLREASSDGR